MFGEWFGESATGFENRVGNPRYIFHIDDEGKRTLLRHRHRHHHRRRRQHHHRRRHHHHRHHQQQQHHHNHHRHFIVISVVIVITIAIINVVAFELGTITITVIVLFPYRCGC